jgi:hypothetical protein
MIKLLLFCILFVVWLILLPFRLVGIAVDGVFDLIVALFSLPGRILRAI